MAMSRPALTKKLSWQDMSTSSPRVHITRRLLQIQNDKSASEIVDGARQICSDYVKSRLEREGLDMFIHPCQRPTRVSRRVQEVGLLLEVCYPGLYTDLSRHVNTSFASKSEVNDVFIGVSSEILSKGVNWARIVALYTFSGALAAECYKRDKKEFVAEMDEWMFEFAALHLVDWIKRKGGWDDLLRIFPDSKILSLLPEQPWFGKFVTQIAEFTNFLLDGATAVCKASVQWYRESR